MKKSLITGLALGLALTATTAFAALIDVNNSNVDEDFNRDGNYGGNGIVGSSHDLSGQFGSSGAGTADAADAKQRICIFCHHPHHAYKPGDLDSDPATQYSPLWNRLTPAEDTFAPYNNGVMMGTTDGTSVSSTRHYMNGSVDVAGVSMLCMSCHDGTTAMNAYSVTTGSDGGNALSTGAALADKAGLAGADKDMSNHHPIGMDWDAVAAVDDEIAKSDAIFGDKYGAILADGTQSAGANPTDVTIASVLYKGKMECVTCHDVHNTQNQAGAERFLWISNNNSMFCLTCHLK